MSDRQLANIWDPNTWLEDDEPYEWRIYGDDRAQRYAIVDEIDYRLFGLRWRWNLLNNSRWTPKWYMRRAVGVNKGNVRLRTYTVYLHVEIMKATGIPMPTPRHYIVDHRNGNSLDCRRANLRWATPSMNRINLRGLHPHDLIEG